MNKQLLTLTTILCLSTPGFATPGGEGNNTGCNGVGNANSPCNPSGGGDNGGGNSGGNPNILNTQTNTQSNILTNTLDIYNQSAAEAISKSNSKSYSSSNSLSNATGGNSTSNSGGNTLSSDQQQTNANNATGNTTNTNISESNVTRFPQQAPPLIQTQITPVNNNGYNAGFSTPFGGFQGGVSRVDKSSKALNFAQASLIEEQRVNQMINNTKKACTLVTESECNDLKALMLRDMGVFKKK